MECSFIATQSQVELQTSWLLRINIFYSTFLTFGTYIGTIYCIHIMKKHPIFSGSTQVLLYLALLFANVHDTAHLVIQWMQMYRSYFYADDPCRIFFEFGEECTIVSRFILFGLSGLIIIHSALSMDGVLATFLPKVYYRKEMLPGVFLAKVTITIICLIHPIILPFGNETKDYVPSCQFFPSYGAARANNFLICSLCATIFNLFLNISLLLFNCRIQKPVRKRVSIMKLLRSSPSYEMYSSSDNLIISNYNMNRKQYNVTFQYQRNEAIMTSKAVSVLLIFQISALGIYAGGSYLFRQARDEIPTSIYHNLIIWVYAISYVTFTLPILIIYCIKYVRTARRRSIHNITTHKESQDMRMDELRSMWS